VTYKTYLAKLATCYKFHFQSKEISSLHTMHISQCSSQLVVDCISKLGLSRIEVCHAQGSDNLMGDSLRMLICNRFWSIYCILWIATGPCLSAVHNGNSKCSRCIFI